MSWRSRRPGSSGRSGGRRTGAASPDTASGFAGPACPAAPSSKFWTCRTKPTRGSGSPTARSSCSRSGRCGTQCWMLTGRLSAGIAANGSRRMSGSAEMLAAFRELTTTKQLERSDLLDLLRDGIHAALMRKYGPNVRFELNVDELQGTLEIIRLRQVVEEVEDASAQVSVEEARFIDPDFQVGDMLEEEVPFQEFGRLAVQAAKQRIIQRVREGERSRIRDEFANRVGELLSGEIQQIERGKLVLMLNKFREAEAIM